VVDVVPVAVKIDDGGMVVVVIARGLSRYHSAVGETIGSSKPLRGSSIVFLFMYLPF
jgi:hypothetical protein